MAAFRSSEQSEASSTTIKAGLLKPRMFAPSPGRAITSEPFSSSIDSANSLTAGTTAIACENWPAS